jgi:uncharacterized protein (UPF0332 family)
VNPLKIKSEQNFTAATLLYDKALYAASIHCSYYGVFQLIKLSVHNFFGLSEHEIQKECSSLKAGTHQFIVNHVFNELQQAKVEDAYMYKKVVKDLKEHRSTSDYSDIEIDQKMCEKALAMSEELKRYLIKNLNV